MGQSASNQRAVGATPVVNSPLGQAHSEVIGHDAERSAQEATSHDNSLGGNAHFTSTAPSQSQILSPPKVSRRQSITQNLKTLMRPNSSSIPDNSVRSRVDSGVSNTESQTSRRRWRTSRRWSKAPEVLHPGRQPPSQEYTNVESVPEQSEGVDADNIAHSSPPSIKGKEIEETLEPEFNYIDRPATPFPASGPSTSTMMDAPMSYDSRESATTSPNAGTSTNIGTWLGGQGNLAESLGVDKVEDQDEVVISPSSFVDDAESEIPSDAHGSVVSSESSAPTPSMSGSNTTTIAPTLTTPDVESPPLPTPPMSRPFPPPGTLVVVQGIVHTTDVNRQPSVPTPAPASSTPATRVRHSSLLSPSPSRTPSTPRSSTPTHSLDDSSPHPRSRLSSLIPRPASLFARNPSTQTLAVEESNVDRDEDEAGASSISGIDTPDTHGSNSVPATPAADTVPESQTQSGMAPALSPSSIDVLGTLLSVAAAATAASLLTGSPETILNPSNRPNSPTPNAGLGNVTSGMGFGGPGSQQNGVDRFRHAWGNLRERLGRRQTNPNDPGLGSGLGSPFGLPNAQGQRVRPDRVPMDAREIMLEEMARAFHNGLGLSNHPSAASAEGSSSAGEENQPSVAPRATQTPAETYLPAEGSFERFLIDLQVDLRATLSATDSTSAQEGATFPASTTETTRAETVATDESERALSSVVPTDVNSEADTVEDSDSNSEEEDELDADTADISETAALPEVDFTIGSASSSRTDRRPGGGINWWRSYRFPAITSPQTQGTSSSTGSTPATVSPLASTSELSESSSDAPLPVASVPGTGSQGSTTPSALPSLAAAEHTTTTVVPVILVGLQSVPLHDPNHPVDSEGRPDDVTAAAGHQGFENTGLGATGNMNHEGVTGMPRGRTWHSRAANAIRNLRPGRRGRAGQGNDAPGSRTFLIYVIGGYYPPDHSIITGADDLDSFEALWELADMLGPGKRQTVSKEDIEQSGLEVIKPAALEQFERDGKVASNCTERCLICLDDYEPDHNLRVLSCKHAFHQECVDQWLSTGKNNCPACRSKGVSDESTDSMPHTATLQSP